MVQNKETRQKMIAVKPATHKALKDLQRELSYGLEMNYSLDDILNMLLISGVCLVKVGDHYNAIKAGLEPKKDVLEGLQ